MSFNNHTFLFSSLDSKQPSTARKVHIRRLYDILQLSIQRHQFQRAKRVWAILVHCKEIDWKGLWSVGLHILSEDTTDEGGEQVAVEYLRSMMLQCSDNVSISIPPFSSLWTNQRIARNHPQRTGIQASSSRKMQRCAGWVGTVILLPMYLPIGFITDKMFSVIYRLFHIKITPSFTSTLVCHPCTLHNLLQVSSSLLVVGISVDVINFS